MAGKTNIGIIICDRYSACAGGKCLRSLRSREGAFSRYGEDEDVELVGYTTCGGCPGGNIEHAPEEMIRNGARVIHLATGMVVGYPPCPHLQHFRDFLGERYQIEVVIGTHPIPQKYFKIHTELGTWDTPEWDEMVRPTLADERTRLDYD